MSGKRRKPEREYSHGDLSITLWKARRRVYYDGFNVQQYDGYRACIQRSEWDLKTGRWRNQQIWMNYEELDCLKIVLDDFYADLDKNARAENSDRISEAAANDAPAVS
jgi:hypothetical protein